MNCFQDLLDNSSVIKLRLLTRVLNIFINSGREAADTPLSAEHFIITLCDLLRSWTKEEISIVGVGVLVMSEKIFILCCMASCMESCNSPSADVPCVRVSAHPSAPASLLPLFNCRSRPSLDSTVPSLTMGCRFRYMQWLPVLVKWKRSILQTERVLPAARRRETRSAHVPGHSADLAATFTVERLEESWEKADSERQVSEEEKSRRLAQGR